MKAFVSSLAAGLLALTVSPAFAADLPASYHGGYYSHDHRAVGSTYWRRGPVAEMRDLDVYVRVIPVYERRIVHRRHYRAHRPICRCKG